MKSCSDSLHFNGCRRNVASGADQPTFNKQLFEWVRFREEVFKVPLVRFGEAGLDRDKIDKTFSWTLLYTVTSRRKHIRFRSFDTVILPFILLCEHCSLFEEVNRLTFYERFSDAAAKTAPNMILSFWIRYKTAGNRVCESSQMQIAFDRICQDCDPKSHSLDKCGRKRSGTLRPVADLIAIGDVTKLVQVTHQFILLP